MRRVDKSMQRTDYKRGGVARRGGSNDSLERR